MESKSARRDRRRGRVLCPGLILLVISLVVPTCATLSLTAHGGAAVSSPKRATTTTVLYSTRAAAKAAASAGSAACPFPGEAGASLPSRLFYNYAGPLLDKASGTRLETSDALELEEGNRMDRTVSVLEGAYRRRRDDARRKKGGNSGGRTVLAKALLESQRSTLLLTGGLRLLNTIIQAFPAVLIARLLRRIEGLGPAESPSGAISAAVQLVAVLSLKMVVENAYFHNVVKCGARVRGSLGGLIFDKSLRLGSAGTPPSSAD